MKKEIISSFNKIRTQLEEHLSSINENSSEIQALFDFLQHLETKIDKVTGRLDKLQLEKNMTEEKKDIKSLNTLEKQVFLLLYMEDVALNYKDIGLKTNLPSPVVHDCVNSLARKGVPIIRSFFNNQQFVQMDKKFKEKQAKENIINISLDSFF
jgi:hypothetical protein